MILKEDVIPDYVNKPLYILAPMIAIIAATIGFAVVPFGPGTPAGTTTHGAPIDFQIAPASTSASSTSSPSAASAFMG